MHGEKGPEDITRIDAKKDLCIWLSPNMSFSLHLERSAQKAFAVLRMIRRIFSRVTRTDFQILYRAYVRPLLGYANPVVYSGRTKDVILIERVQRAATKMVAGLKSMDYETRLVVLDLFPLEYRRLRGDLIPTHALFEQGLANRFFTVDPANTRRGHDLRLSVVSRYSDNDTRRWTGMCISISASFAQMEEDLSKEDLLRLLACLQSELEARDVVINTLKLVSGDTHVEEVSKSTHDTPLIQLEKLVSSQRFAQEKLREQLQSTQEKYVKVAYEKVQKKKLERILKRVLVSWKQQRLLLARQKQAAVFVIKEHKRLLAQASHYRRRVSDLEAMLSGSSVDPAGGDLSLVRQTFQRINFQQCDSDSGDVSRETIEKPTGTEGQADVSRLSSGESSLLKQQLTAEMTARTELQRSFDK
ncbi:hypothetical protein CLF_103605 [Clonorchis sinensis]|uniref:Cortactin-binding protein-2 N-terminal domain-containing protein n=1 Tax=Clonorchis sinensis TaxID=79923 RepID=G7YA07_CLOSI|nr:hypothetical protein CLF_103605 [Clonorchis sinensis]